MAYFREHFGVGIPAMFFAERNLKSHNHEPLKHLLSFTPCSSLPIEDIARGINGFEELRKIIKQGAEFCKDVSVIMHERAEMESTYAKGLTRLSQKLLRTSGNSFGTLAEGWKSVAIEMEQEAELHKNFGKALLEEISKPLKALVDIQHKARRPIENVVEKSLKMLTERRNEEYKAKKIVFNCAKDGMKAEEQMTEAKKDTKSKYTEKDINKLEKKCRQYQETLQKVDKEYNELCQKAEAARQEWEFSVSKGAAQMQVLEEDRITKMQEELTVFNSNISVLGPKFMQSFQTLDKAVSAVDLKMDLEKIVKDRGTGLSHPEQILLDCYAEDMSINMNLEGRKQALKNYIYYILTAIDREKRGKEGVEKLLQVYKDRPNFADRDAEDDAKHRLIQVTYTMNFLEASHYKINSAVCVLNGQNKPSHKFAQYIEQTKDRQGIPTTVLKLPVNMALEGNTDYLDSQLEPISPYERESEFSDDEFDSDGFDYLTVSSNQCRALYNYDANESDELSFKSGDVITIYKRQPDGWWQGELCGKAGIFPANYVEEI